MKWFAAAVLAITFALAGCGKPVPVHDCQTAGGMYVRHGVCDSELEALQAGIEREAAALGYRRELLFDVLLEVRPDGFPPPNGGPGIAMGLTYCDSGMMILVRPEATAWRNTALAHEAFHLAQNCVWDRIVEAECLTRPYKPGEYRNCADEAQHPHWDLAIYPAINRLALAEAP